MTNGGDSQLPQGLRQLRAHLGDDVKAERFDGHQLFEVRFKRAKHRSQDAAADLVQDAIGAEGGRCGKTGGVVEWQRRNSCNDHCTLARGMHSL
jgi:hypothetical protein